MRDLLSEWLRVVESGRVTAAIQAIDRRLPSSAGYMQVARATVEGLDRAADDGPRSFAEVRARWAKLAPKELRVPAPHPITESQAYSSLRQHLEGDPLWEEWEAADESTMDCSSRAWVMAYRLVAFADAWLAGWSAANGSVPIEYRQHLALVVGDPAYRDTALSALREATWCLACYLVPIAP